jgi:hypothetical protein
MDSRELYSDANGIVRAVEEVANYANLEIVLNLISGRIVQYRDVRPVLVLLYDYRISRDKNIFIKFYNYFEIFKSIKRYLESLGTGKVFNSIEKFSLKNSYRNFFSQINYK